MVLLTMRARAYVHAGRWIIDCIRPGCTNAELLESRQAVMHCTNCRLVSEVEWPADADDIWEALVVRPVPQTRNWAPVGHRQAVACGFPDGQRVADLWAENAEHGLVGDRPAEDIAQRLPGPIAALADAVGAPVTITNGGQ